MLYKLLTILLLSTIAAVVILNFLKNIKMSEQLDAISANLDAANASLLKIKADIATLNGELQSADTPEALEAVKAKSAQLVVNLNAVDEETPDAPTAG